MSGEDRAGLRRCPLCERVFREKLCAEDRIATLLVETPSISAATVAVGAILGDRYRIERVLAANGSSAVFEALYVRTGQKVALKVLSLDQGEGRDVALRRFFLEAHLSSGLTHPNTIRVFDFGQDDSGLPFLAMELLSGTTLRAELVSRRREGRTFSELEAVEIGVAIARSLTEAHHAGLIHRDIKPENVFLEHVGDEAPVVKVLDFGIAKLAGDGARLTAAAVVLGTPTYMSPEQVLSRTLDARSDLYSLGLVLYELVSGERAFTGVDPVDIAYARVRGATPDLRSHAARPVSEAFAAVVSRALMRFPEERFADAAEMRAALELCRAQSTRAAVATPVPRAATIALEPAGTTRLLAPPSKNGWARWVIAAATALTAIAAATAIALREPERVPEPAVVLEKKVEPPRPPPALPEPAPVEIETKTKTKRPAPVPAPDARKKRLERIFETRI